MGKTLKITDKTYTLLGGGVISAPTMYGTKQALSLLFQTTDDFETVKTLFSDATKTATIVVTDENNTTTAYVEYLHLDSTITITNDGTSNTFSLKLYQDEDVTLQKQLTDTQNALAAATAKIATLTTELSATQQALDTIILG